MIVCGSGFREEPGSGICAFHLHGDSAILIHIHCIRMVRSGQNPECGVETEFTQAQDSLRGVGEDPAGSKRKERWS